MSPAILLLPVAAYTGIASIWDFRTRRIPNWLTVGFFAAGLIFHTVANGLDGLLHALGGFGVGFGILFVLWLIGGGGAGDVKMMGGLGAWLGAPLTLIVVLSSAVLGLLATILVVAWKAFTTPADAKPKPKQGIMRRTIPYAVPVAVATWLVLGLKLLSTHST